jgi:branched-chain amino acid transport system substrate-binding protein
MSGWWAMRASARVWLLTGFVLALTAGCGGAETPVRIGVLSDCYGPFSSAHELIVASSELPLLERGGKLRGPSPSDGVEDVSVAGRPVELLIGCITGTEDVLPETRRLVEEEGADVVVGPLYPEHGLVVRDYARRHPDTTFLTQPSGAPELTLTDPARNVFRFTTDNAQNAAGLGSFAYHELGWRRAAVVADDSPYGWGNVAGFVAEFCALGGRIIQRNWIPFLSEPAQVLPNIPSSTDGVYLDVVLSPVHTFLRRYSETGHDLPTHVLANAAILSDLTVVPRARGIVVGGSQPFEPPASAAAYVEAFTKAFPSIPAAAALSVLAVPYRDGVEAALEGLERSDGATGPDLMAALADLELGSLNGTVRLDRTHQAVASNYLSRVAHQGKPEIRTLRVVPDVEQTFGGYFKPGDPPPSRTAPACRRHKPPPWAQ